MNSSTAPKLLLIYGIVLPLAALLGYQLANPETVTALSIIGAVLAILALPLLLRWHYPLLLFAWGANITIFFLPGQPDLWICLSGFSLGLTLLSSFLDKRIKLQNVPSVSWALFFLCVVILVTARLTGGVGLRVLGGGSYGGKKLFILLAGVMGYFALSAVPVPAAKVNGYSSLFMLSGLTAVVSNLIYYVPPLYFLYLIFPVDNAITQATDDFGSNIVEARFYRMPGAAVAGSTVCYFMLMRYGLRGLFGFGHAWRFAVFIAAFAVSMFGGFRSVLVSLGMVICLLFYLERLHRTRALFAVLLSAVLGVALLIPIAPRLPLSVQRSLTVLPFDLGLDRNAIENARSSLEWRWEMWRVLRHEIPQYFWLGKGYHINPTDLYLVDQAVRRGIVHDYETSLLSGDYHSGPLSVLIPFGIFGVLAFVALIIVAFRVVLMNFRYGPDHLQRINKFLLAFFTSKVIFFFFFFGSFHSDLRLLLGLVGISIGLNGGLRKPVPAAAEFDALPQPA